ncbi:hypothetical protein N474_18315 [Pseudoalteromonas luteoviolacea CPMOR-2]|uniref:Uncharacterized protein n=1 Tax=Pseudoalteromonas luteoviolacea DSM 6061 TaxID=1365250 RepID=A0A166W517_9GAMM|nr:hypothetical protein [Pseudoalteromonas luteoviolacea]KZN35732.1 hypothetical protein N475_18005 [Pseudoalteromonas luteoviolacea DSM 6061]KZN54305.1 hypothetical protein N474_18315 [Pseudoalteromonas luteoviolacea CPMOR-2]MBE0389211.1 hypothetical protein [Pseudoalteromonas luteoviolacea DSM 6061]
MENFVLIAGMVLVIINIMVSVLIFRRVDIEKFQKIAQTIIVWLIPFVGGVGLWLFYRGQDQENKPGYKRPFGGGTVDSAGSGD